MSPRLASSGVASYLAGARIAPVLAAAVIAAVLLPESLAQRLEWQREAFLAGEAWRLWTAPFTHHGTAHATANAIVLLVTGVLAERAAGPGRVAAVLAIAALASGLGQLAFMPAMESCRGASSLAWALAGLALWAGPAGGLPLARWALAGLAVVKFCLEMTGAPGATLPEGVAVAWAGHAAGFAGGIVLAPASPATRAA